MSWKHMDWQSLDDQREQMAARYRIAERGPRSISDRPLTEKSDYCKYGLTDAPDPDSVGSSDVRS